MYLKLIWFCHTLDSKVKKKASSNYIVSLLDQKLGYTLETHHVPVMEEVWKM